MAALLPVMAPRASSNEASPFPLVLGTYATTLIGSHPARSENIRLAAGALDGTVLEPGEVLSFNRAVGPRTVERGYQAAPVILRDARDVQVGGGICQVASTLFDAALLAGLEVVERHRHTYSVDYVPPGQDATIAWSVKDLKIRNGLDQRVRVRLEVLGATLAARIEGENSLPAEYELALVERELPATDPAGAPGREVELYRVERVEGREVGRSLVHRDVYPPTLLRGARP